MKAKLFLLGIIALVLASCTKKEAEVTCKKVVGATADLVTVEDKSYILSRQDAENDVTLSIKVAFKLAKSLAGIEGLAEENIELEAPLEIRVYNEDGQYLGKIGLDGDSATYEFKHLLQGKVGDTKEIAFKGSFTPDDAKNIMKGAKSFNVESVKVGLKNVNLSGSVDRYGVSGTINISGDGMITGAYYYTRMGSANLLYLKGMRGANDAIQMEEYTAAGQNTGSWEGTFVGSAFTGVFTSPSHVFNYTLSPDHDMTAIDFSNISFDRFGASYAPSASSSSADTSSGVSEFMQEYAEFVHNFVDAVKKMDKDDPTAALEILQMSANYASLLQKVESDKASLSADDLQLLTELQREYAEALSEVQ